MTGNGDHKAAPGKFGASPKPLNLQSIHPLLRGLLFVGLAAVLASLHSSLLSLGHVFPFFYLAVVATAVYGGTRSAVYAVSLSVIACYFIFREFPGVIRGLHLGLFVFVSLVLVAVVERMHRVTEELQESERRFRDMLANVELVAQILDREGRITYCNDHMLQLTGWRADELVGRDAYVVLAPPEKVAEMKQTRRRLIANSPGGWHVDTEIMTKAGDRRWVRWNSTVLRSRHGEFLGTANIGRDITEERRTEYAHKLLAAIIQSSHDAIITATLDGIITTWNPAAEKLFEYTAAEMVGRSVLAIVPDDRRGESAENLRRLTEGSARHLETVRMGRNGRRIDVSMSLSPIIDAAGNTIGISGIYADNGARKEAEARFRELSHQLLLAEDQERGRIAKELHDSTAQNLIAVMMKLENLREEVAVKQPREGRQIEDCLAILESSIHDVRTLAYVLHPAQLNEGGLAAALQHYGTGFGERTGIDMTLELQPDFGRPPAAVELVFFRLVQEALGNVHRHAHARSARIRLWREASAIGLEIGDTGRGMALDASGNPVRMGVGIAGMRERMRQIGGQLTITSGPGGTVVCATVSLQKAAV